MADPQDLRKRYDELVKLRDERKQQLLEAKAARKHLEERQAELLTELKTFGLDSLESLEAHLQKEEQEIGQLLRELTQAVTNPPNQPKQLVQPQQTQVSDLDELLRLGASS